MENFESVLDLSMRYPFINESGIAVEFFPDYRNNSKLMHAHNCVEIGLVVSGSGTHFVGNKQYPVEKGSLWIIHYNQHHNLLTDKMSLYNIYLYPERMIRPVLPQDLNNLYNKYIPLAPGLKHELNNIYQFYFPEGVMPEDLLRRMVVETDQNRNGCIAALNNLYQLFILDCIRTIKEIPEKRKLLKESDARIETIRLYMENHLQENLSPSILSNKFGFNKEYLCRRFKKYTGKTICQYSIAARIQKIIPILLERKRNIAEIAYDHGFNDLSHFNRSFRKVIGLSPTEYIKNCIK